MTEHSIVEPHIKRQIWERQHEKCAYCGTRRQLKHMTVDHIIPLSRGGADDESNMCCACKNCNRLKANLLPTEFSQYLHMVFINNLQFCEMELIAKQ